MTNDNITSAAAGAAMVSPWWLPQLHEISVVAAELAPILGALWLVTQIVAKFYEMWKKNNKKDDLPFGL